MCNRHDFESMEKEIDEKLVWNNMKVLVATKEGQGIRKTDFSWTNEVVWYKY